MNAIIQSRPSNFAYINPTAVSRRAGWNPRFDFGEIEELAKSIQANGMLIPIRVKKVGEGFELIDGDRRLTAVEHLIAKGEVFAKGIPALLEDKNSDDLGNLIKMFESNSGKAFLPLEEAAAYKRMRDAGMTLKQIGDKVGRKHVHIVDTLRLLEADDSVKDALKNKKINATTAKAIAKTSKEKQAGHVEQASGAGKGKRTQLKRDLEDGRTNKRKSTPPKYHPMTQDELKSQEEQLLVDLQETATNAGWDLNQVASVVRQDDALVAAATYGLLLGIRLALGKKIVTKL